MLSYNIRITVNTLSVFILCLFFSGCSFSQTNLKQSINNELPSFEEIREYIMKDTLLKPSSFIYPDSLKSKNITKKLSQLKNKGLLSFYSNRFRAPIFYGGMNCLIFFLKTDRVGAKVYEHILVYNNDEGRELYCVSNLYSVNTKEEINEMDVSLFKIDGSMTYVIIKHDKTIGL